MSAILLATSTEYVRVAVSATEDGAVVDPTEDDVFMAFVTTFSPADDDFVAAQWETDGTTHYARCLIGPDGTQLDAGRYRVFVKVSDSPETPVKRAGSLTVQ